MKHRTKGIAQSQRILFFCPSFFIYPPPSFIIYRFLRFSIFHHYFWNRIFYTAILLSILSLNFYGRLLNDIYHSLLLASPEDSLSELYSLDERFGPEFEEFDFQRKRKSYGKKNTENGQYMFASWTITKAEDAHMKA